VVKHIESWDVEPGRVVKQLLKPSAKIPATQVSVASPCPALPCLAFREVLGAVGSTACGLLRPACPPPPALPQLAPPTPVWCPCKVW